MLDVRYLAEAAWRCAVNALLKRLKPVCKAPTGGINTDRIRPQETGPMCSANPGDYSAPSDYPCQGFVFGGWELRTTP